jgi:hypothetical protein
MSHTFTLAGPNPLLWPGEKTTLITGSHHAHASPPDRLQSPPTRRSPARRPSSTSPPTLPLPLRSSARWPPGALPRFRLSRPARRMASGDFATDARPLAHLCRSAPTVRGSPASWPLAARLSASLSQSWLELETKRKKLYRKVIGYYMVLAIILC